jgi:lipoate-protein ligase A
VQESITHLKSWEWLYQYTPQFTNNIEEKFTWGLMDIYFDVHQGLVKSGRVFSDCLHPELIESLNDALNSGEVKYDFDGMNGMCSRVRGLYPHYGEYLTELNDWLNKCI